MRILVDADGTNRIKHVVDVAKQYGVPVTLFCDCSREMHSGYADVVYSDVRSEATDITLLNQCRKGDIVITRDIGLAGIALAKGARVLHDSGRLLDNRTIDRDLAFRAMMQRMRKNTKHYSQTRKVSFGMERGNCDFHGNLVMLIKRGVEKRQDSLPPQEKERLTG